MTRIKNRDKKKGRVEQMPSGYTKVHKIAEPEEYMRTTNTDEHNLTACRAGKSFTVYGAYALNREACPERRE